MLNDLSALERQFDAMVQEQLLDAGAEAMRLVVSMTFNMIVDNTVVWSGYAAANQRIAIGTLDDAELNPRIRRGNPYPASGEYEGLIEPSRAQELAKLADLQFGEAVEIGTAVGYFPDIGWTEGLGTDIYTEASIVGPELAQGAFTQP
ncbi:hypothetical protein [Thalassobaculum litoreum]|uniref:Uncharacterized protein n=1 Tax=Thalassobaculum litoreum DSM 18839 TaxID=1123362 RepID=A0A8G2BI23_9PROT|nr:hypothetical protein [Thalassobaculum litoreum]SDF83657.1 hypothetical protein SAMN05660686_02476 [Thalassobaculum litoreum DSM 18839]